MGLHIELTSNSGIVVNDQIGDPGPVQFLPDGQSCGSCSNDRHNGFINGYGTRLRYGFFLRKEAVGDPSYLLYPVYFSDADPAHLTVNKHFTGTALPDTTGETPVSVFQAVLVDQQTGLMQSRGNRKTFLTIDCLTFKRKCNFILFRNGENGMFLYR